MAKQVVKPIRDFDKLFLHLNSFGRYQKIVFFSLQLLVFPVGMQFDALVFAFSSPNFHCITPNVTCADKTCCFGCDEYQFDGLFHSTVSEWNLICDRAQLAALMNSSFFVGMLLGSLVTGMVSDKFGRKACVFASDVLLLFAGVGSCFVDCFSFMVFLCFLVGFGQVGVILSLYVLNMELVGPSYRTAAGNFNQFMYSVVSLCSIFCAYFLRDWRWFLFVSTIPGALLLPFWRIFPESPRWLMARDRLDEARAVLMKYGWKNNQPVDEDELTDLIQDVRRHELATMAVGKTYSPLDLLRTRKMRKWTIILCYQWFAIAMIIFGLILFFTQLHGNIYINYAIVNTITGLKVAIAFIAFLKFGRRLTHGVCIITTAVVLLSILAVYDDYPIVTTVLALLGFIIMDTNMTAVSLITSEIFPTVIRNTGQGVGSMAGRVGALAAPYVSMMNQLPGLGIAFPVVIFGVLALTAGILMYWLPETLHAPMHQTIGEAESAEEDFSIPCCGKQPEPTTPLVAETG